MSEEIFDTSRGDTDPDFPGDAVGAEAPPANQPPDDSEEPGGLGEDSRSEPQQQTGTDGASARIDAKTLTAQAVFNANSLGHLEFNVGGGNRLEQVSAEHFEEVDARALDDLFGEIALDPMAVERGHNIIARAGILCVVGKPGCGKGTFGLAVAQRLLLAGDVDKTLLCRPLESQVRVRPQSLGDRLGGQHQRLLVFEDALACENRDLRRFLEDLDSSKLSIVAANLVRQRTRLLFTLEEGSVADCLPELRRTDLVFDMPVPTERQVLEIIRREAGRLHSEVLGDQELVEALTCLLEHSGTTIYQRLGSIPEVIRFCRSSLLGVLEQRLELEVALDQLEDLTAWFLDQAARDREGWCELLALTLAASSPATATVPWLAHRRLTEALSKRLRRSLGDEDTPLRTEEIFASHLEKGRLARVEHKPEPEGEVLRFAERALAERLWQVLVGSGRSISWWLAPLLAKLAMEDDPVLARVAAKALGRIGELAPESLTYATFKRWAQADPTPVPALAGLFSGALASRRDDYRQGVLEWLHRRLRHASDEETWAACICLPVVADHDAQRAADELFGALDERFAPRDGEPIVRRHLLTVADSLRKLRRPLGDWATARLFPQPRHHVFLAGMQYAITGFCFSSERMGLLNRIRTRIASEEDDASLLVVMSFFEPQGVLDTVERFPVHLRDDAAVAWSDSAYSRFLASAMLEDAAPDLAGFLQTAWRRLAEVPVPFRRALRQRLLDQLRRWSKEPPPGSVGETLGEVLSLLLESPEEELAERVFDLLRADPVFRPGEPGSWLAETALSLRSPPRSNTTEA